MRTYDHVARLLSTAWLLAGLAEPAAAQFPLDLDRLRSSMPVPNAAMVVTGRDGAIREVSPNTKSITVAPGEYVFAKTAEKSTEVSAPAGTGTALQLPVTLATVGATGAQIALGIVVRTGGGLMPRVDAPQYEGRIYVGLVNTLDPLTAIALPAPVQVTLAGPVDSITPDQPRFEATNTFVPVTVIARDPRNPVELRVSTGVDIDETVVPVAVFSASVSVVMSVPSIAGFGFETADVTVQANGIPNLVGMPVTLFLQGGGGSFLPASQLSLDASGRAIGKLRSSGLSPNVVVAAALGNGATAQAAPIQYVGPFAWLAFAVGGGVMGGVLKQLTGKRRAWLAATVVSVVLGFLAAGLYMLGVSTIPMVPAGTGGQLVVTVVAALSAIGGVGLLPVPRR